MTIFPPVKSDIQHPQGKEEEEETKEKETHEIITAQQQYHLKTSDVHFDRNERRRLDSLGRRSLDPIHPTTMNTDSYYYIFIKLYTTFKSKAKDHSVAQPVSLGKSLNSYVPVCIQATAGVNVP